jgi:TRAP-type C4-dicarboxylate transport system permease small subunit
MRHTDPVSTGKRAGSRRGARPPRTLNRAALVIGAAITLCVVAWGYLVYAAIDFGTAAREGNSSAWTYMALACVGAIACLFVGLLLVARLMRALGITSAPETPSSDSPVPPGPRPVGGKRAAR